MLDVHAAVGRAVLNRVSELRRQHATRDAQALWDWARGVGSPVQLGTLSAQPDTPSASLRELAEIQRGRLALAQDSDAGYTEAMEAFAGVEQRVFSAPEPLTGERRRRVLLALSVSYSGAGQEQRAIRVSERESRLHFSTLDRDAAALRHATAGRPPLRAADELHNHALRLAKLAFLDRLAGTPALNASAADLLDRAEACVGVAAELRRSRHGRLLERVCASTIALERAMLDDDTQSRRAALEAVVRETLSVVAESRTLAEVGPNRLINRQARYGAALAELAAVLNGPEAASTAQLARVCLAPLVAVHEVDAVYNPSPLIRYGDACALTGDMVRARQAWLRARTRLMRSRPTHPAHASLERRLTGA